MFGFRNIICKPRTFIWYIQQYNSLPDSYYRTSQGTIASWNTRKGSRQTNLIKIFDMLGQEVIQINMSIVYENYKKNLCVTKGDIIRKPMLRFSNQFVDQYHIEHIFIHGNSLNKADIPGYYLGGYYRRSINKRKLSEINNIAQNNFHAIKSLLSIAMDQDDNLKNVINSVGNPHLLFPIGLNTCAVYSGYHLCRHSKNFIAIMAILLFDKKNRMKYRYILSPICPCSNHLQKLQTSVNQQTFYIDHRAQFSCTKP